MNKFNARKVKLGGFIFDSQAEAARYRELLLLEKADQIDGLRVHVGYCLQEGFVAADGQRIQPITYICDFRYIEDGREIVEDVKGMETAEFRIKRKLFLRRYPEMEFRLVKA